MGLCGDSQVPGGEQCRWPDDECWSLAGLPAAQNFLASAMLVRASRVRRKVSRSRTTSDTFLIDPTITLISNGPPVPGCSAAWSVKGPTNLGLQATSSLPRHHTGNLLQPSHLPALRSTKFFKAPYLQPSTLSIIRRILVEFPAHCRKDRFCLPPTESTKLWPTTLHT
jgi:hypothetical protein